MKADKDTGTAGGADELITVQTFAERFRVDASVVRSWIKAGLIPFTLVGTRRMVRRSDILKPVVPPVPVPPPDNAGALKAARNRLILHHHLTIIDGMDPEVAYSVADSMSPIEIETTIAGYQSEYEGGHDGGTD